MLTHTEQCENYLSHSMSESFTSDSSCYSRDSNFTPSWTDSSDSAFRCPANSPPRKNQRASHHRYEDSTYSEMAVYRGGQYGNNPAFTSMLTPIPSPNRIAPRTPHSTYADNTFSRGYNYEGSQYDNTAFDLIHNLSNIGPNPVFCNNTPIQDVPELSHTCTPVSCRSNASDILMDPSKILNYNLPMTPMKAQNPNIQIDLSAGDFTHNLESPPRAEQRTINFKHAKVISNRNLKAPNVRRARRFVAETAIPQNNKRYVAGRDVPQNLYDDLLVRNSDVFELQITVHPKDTFKCLSKECVGKIFKRLEHLKRHHISSHTKDPRHCPIPGCNKVFNGRADNLRSHLLLHTKQGPDRSKACRTSYHPDAAGVLAKIKSKSRRAINAKAKTDHEHPCDKLPSTPAYKMETDHNNSFDGMPINFGCKLGPRPRRLF